MADLRAALPGHQEPKPGDPVSGPLELKELRRYFDDARTLTQDARTDSELCRDYYDGKQFTPAELLIYRARKQPPIIFNFVQLAVDSILGVVQQGKTDPRALMRNPTEEAPAQPQMGQPMPGQEVMGGNGGPPLPKLDAGDIASMALRFIADTTHFPALRQDVLENGIIEGCGAAIYEVDGDKNILATQIRWEEFFYDPYSRRYDFQDARYMGIAKWMYADDLGRLYPDVAESMASFNVSGIMGGGPDLTWQDRPSSGAPWIDSAKKRVMVVEMYHRHGADWYRVVLYCNQILEYAVSPYKDDRDRPICPIEAWSAYVDRENRRYGPVKRMRDPQDEINMRRSKSLHEANSRQIQQEDPNAPPIDAGLARTEAAKPDGIIPPGWKVVPRQDVVANNLNMYLEAKGVLERMAPAPSVLGRGAQSASGRAQQVNQQAGLTELAPVLGRHHDWQRRSYAQMWNRARQFWDAPKWIRVTNENEAPKYVRVNEPGPEVTQFDPATGQQMMVPGPPGNHIAKMDVDIVLEDVPDTATLEQEIFAELSKLAQVYGPEAVPFEIILEASSLPEKRKIIDKLKAYQGQKVQAQAAAGQAAQEKAAADVEKTRAETANKNANTSLTEVKTVTAALDGALSASAAGTDAARRNACRTTGAATLNGR